MRVEKLSGMEWTVHSVPLTSGKTNCWLLVQTTPHGLFAMVNFMNLYPTSYRLDIMSRQINSSRCKLFSCKREISCLHLLMVMRISSEDPGEKNSNTGKWSKFSFKMLSCL